MATEQHGDFMSREASGSFVGKQYCIAQIDANGKFLPATGATQTLMGVAQNEAVLGDTVSVALANGSGTYKVKLGATVAAGDLLTTNASGLAIATVAAGNKIIGRALSAGLVNQVIEVEKMSRTL